jgi:hypothetical protein
MQTGLKLVNRNSQMRWTSVESDNGEDAPNVHSIVLPILHDYHHRRVILRSTGFSLLLVTVLLVKLRHIGPDVSAPGL